MRSKRRRELKKKVALLGIVTHQSNLRFASFPAGEPFGNVANSTQKLSPFTGKVSRRSRDERGTVRRCRAILLFPLSFAYAQQLPRRRWRLLVRLTNSYVKPALKGEVDMSVSEWTEGLHRSCSCLRQPLSRSALRRFASSLFGEPFSLPPTQKLSPFTGKVSRRSRDERGTARRCRAL